MFCELPHDRKWYEAIGRLTGHTAYECWAIQYPMQSTLTVARIAAVRAWIQTKDLDQEMIMKEMERKPRVLYACCFKDLFGDLVFFDGPSPSFQAMHESKPPDDAVGTAYIVKLEGDTVAPVARWNGSEWICKKEKQ